MFSPCRKMKPTLYIKTNKRLTPVTRALPVNKVLTEAIRTAYLICSITNDKAMCAVAWDNVDEITRGIHRRKEYIEKDPLIQYCTSHPDADECRIYDV